MSKKKKFYGWDVKVEETPTFGVINMTTLLMRYGIPIIH